MPGRSAYCRPRGDLVLAPYRVIEDDHDVAMLTMTILGFRLRQARDARGVRAVGDRAACEALEVIRDTARLT